MLGDNIYIAKQKGGFSMENNHITNKQSMFNGCNININCGGDSNNQLKSNSEKAINSNSQYHTSINDKLVVVNFMIALLRFAETLLQFKN